MIDPLDTENPATLKAAREARGLTLTALAEKSGVHASTVMRLERGQPPLLATWQPIVKALLASPVSV